MIDQKTIERLKLKSEDAFEYVYQETKRSVYSMIFSILKNHQATEDLMQDVYMKMMVTINQFQKGTNFNNWLITMAKNLAIDTYRRDQKITRVDPLDFDERLQTYDAPPDESTKFELMMNLLNEEQRSVVILKIADEMKFKDIAKVLNMPINTVIWIYQEAMKILRKIEE